MHQLIEQFMRLFGEIGYGAIGVLMILESSIFPVPSELVMIPAGINAANGQINPFVATLVGGISSVIGALLNYFIIGKFLGKPFLEKYGKYILITYTKYKKAEDLFQKNAVLYTFIGRLLPVIRHIISIPAGIFRMPVHLFILVTFLGATLWCGILVGLGYFLGPHVIALFEEYNHYMSYIVLLILPIYIWYVLFRRKRANSKK